MLMRAIPGRCSSVLHASWSARQKVLLSSIWTPPASVPSLRPALAYQQPVRVCSAAGRKGPSVMDAVQQPSGTGSQDSLGQSSGKRQRTEEDGSKAVQENGAQADNATEGASTAGKREQKRSKKEKKPLGELGQLTHAVHMAARHTHYPQVGELLQQIADKELKPTLSTWNSLLYTSLGGDLWEVLLRGATIEKSAVHNVATAHLGGAYQPPEGGMPSFDEGDSANGSSAPGAPAAGASSTTTESGKATHQRKASLMSLQEHIALAERAWAGLQAQGLKPDSGTLLSLARLAALQGNPKQALEWAKQVPEAGDTMSLRHFHPAMAGFALQRDSAAALELDAFLTEQGLENLDRTEYEFCRLLEVLAADPSATWQQFRGVLQRMSRELQELQPSTLDLITAYFNSPKGQAACTADSDLDTSPVPRTRWQLTPGVVVKADGSCTEAGGTLQVLDLEGDEWQTFAEAIAGLAQRNEAQNDFAGYMQWYDRQGPYDILIDGANVAFYGQNREGGGFDWGQIMRMVQTVEQRHPDKKYLLMMNVRRIRDSAAQAPQVLAFLDKLKAKRAFHYTPKGSNDDWYWLYAAVKSKGKGLLISNDELRDHIFSLLRPKHFLKWKAHHIAHYTFPGPNTFPVLQYPPSFTFCVQRLSQTGAWMFPSTQGTWLCIRPV